MQKIKFQIKGMHCSSCATLIEERLKEKPGVNQAKVSFDSKKAVVVYDEAKIGEQEIGQTIERAGDYKIEKMEDDKPKEEDGMSSKIGDKQKTSSSSFKTGFLMGVALISVGFNIFFATSLNKSNSAAEADTAGNNNQAVQQQGGQVVAGATVQNFDITAADHVRGNFNAPITLVEFSDFECPFCERHFPTVNKILKDYGDKVRLVYKQFPLPSHPNAQKAAEASECAGEQNKFWEYHDKLFENQPTGFGLDKFKQWAKDLNLDTAKFNSCLDTGKFAAKVQDDLKEGQQKGVNGTPATFVNGKLVSGAVPYETFKQIIDNLLNK